MKIGSFEFSLRELAGAMGDFGTLFPLAIGYIAVCGLDPAGLLVMMGLTNIATGLIYRVPMPVEPMKVLAVVAIAQRWTPEMVYASGFAMGVVWLLLGLTGMMGRLARFTPRSVIRGIQVALGVLLALEALRLIEGAWLLGAVSLLLVLLLRDSRYAPAAVVLMALGVGVMGFQGNLAGLQAPSFAWPSLTGFSLQDSWRTMLLAGFSQVPLTATNAVIATAVLIREYWPERTVSEKQLAVNMGVINLLAPFAGGMPMCHGAGGLAGQYYFGARSGGANLLEGAMELAMGLFLAGSIAALFAAFPSAIIGAMMLLVGIEMTRFARDVRWDWNLAPLLMTVLVSLLFNMAVGFLAGLLLHYVLLRWLSRLPSRKAGP
ncbi:putative sulfate/molybdate transporter [Desulfuromonas sp. CSMB_57]|jgi:MFS superfamily sulfate permease-like transporter|uniref:putative sulfate/molybdate transporter n=1 Tax=Desulfuromonas sp. CSMB_57 TaxID=2807629 RepID=UPI001CD2DCD0|nr:putative sulfate/molybdate transporter [Desulfuromonas sp. CSMB_57]